MVENTGIAKGNSRWALQNPRRERFAQLVAEGKTTKDAYVAAGFKGDQQFVYGAASALAIKPEVKARIEALKQEGAEAAVVNVKRIVTELARIAFADLTDVVEIIGDKLTVKESRHWPRGFSAAVSKIYRSREGEVRIELYNKTAALETLARHLSMFKDQVDLNVQVSLADLVNGSYELERQRKAAEQAIDVTPTRVAEDGSAEQRLIQGALIEAERHAVDHADSVDEAAKPTDTADGGAPDPPGGE